MRHLKTQSGEKPNKCNQCDYASSRVGNLRTHLKTHRNRKKTNQSIINPLGFSNRRRLDRATGTFVLHQSNVTLCPSQYRTVSSIPIGSPFSIYKRGGATSYHQFMRVSGPLHSPVPNFFTKNGIFLIKK